MDIPFTYLVTSKSTGQMYYGVKYAMGCHPDDLWTIYFTSSEYVKELIEQYGVEDFIVEVDKTFPGDPEAACEHERLELIRRDVLNEDLYLNANIGADKWCRAGVEVTEETRKKRRATMLKRGPVSDVTKAQMKESHRVYQQRLRNERAADPAVQEAYIVTRKAAAVKSWKTRRRNLGARNRK